MGYSKKIKWFYVHIKHLGQWLYMLDAQEIVALSNIA